MRTVRCLTMTLVGALALAVSAALPASAIPRTNPGVTPPWASKFVSGKTYGELSAAWFKYALEQPTPTNPLIDQTGVNCNFGQSGPVFFLVGLPGGGSVTRDACTVPAGRSLFFPLINAFEANNPGENRNSWDVWQKLEKDFGPISELHASIDDVPVRDLNPVHTPYRACAGPAARCSAGPFSITLPANNIFGADQGRYAPTVADGFYLLLRPLSRGSHTITFGGSGLYAGEETSQEITYHLTVS